MKIVIVKLQDYLLTPIYIVVFGLLLVVFHPIQMICRHIWGYNAHKKSVVILNLLIIFGDRHIVGGGRGLRLRRLSKHPHGHLPGSGTDEELMIARSVCHIFCFGEE